jgi:hypothetical protein
MSDPASLQSKSSSLRSSDTHFVNEHISPEDVDRYHLEEIDQKFVIGGVYARDWTIDRTRDVYLRIATRGREDWRNQTEWTFYWKGDLLILRLDLLDARGGNGEPGWSHWRLAGLNGSRGLPVDLKAERTQIFDSLKEALTAYGGAGVYSANYPDYSVTLDIAKECTL